MRVSGCKKRQNSRCLAYLQVSFKKIYTKTWPVTSVAQRDRNRSGNSSLIGKRGFRYAKKLLSPSPIETTGFFGNRPALRLFSFSGAALWARNFTPFVNRFSAFRKYFSLRKNHLCAFKIKHQNEECTCCVGIANCL